MNAGKAVVVGDNQDKVLWGGKYDKFYKVDKTENIVSQARQTIQEKE